MLSHSSPPHAPLLSGLGRHTQEALKWNTAAKFNYNTLEARQASQPRASIFSLTVTFWSSSDYVDCFKKINFIFRNTKRFKKGESNGNKTIAPFSHTENTRSHEHYILIYYERFYVFKT